MKYEKETNGPKNPNVVVKKSAFEEFLDEWGSWRGKRTGEKIADSIRKRQAEENLPTAERIKLKRKRQQTKFMDSGFMLVIKMFAGLIDIMVSAIFWVFSLVFSFKFWVIVGVIVYFSDIDIKTMAIKAVSENSEEIIQHLEEGTEKFNKSLDEKRDDIDKIIQKNETTLDSIKEKLKGIQINIKKSDGTEHTFDGGDVDKWFGTGAAFGWNSDMPAEPVIPLKPEAEKTE